MAQNIGTLVTAAIRPNDSLDLIASAYANEIMGGLHRATASTDRDAIITARREWGMMCYVINENKLYQLSYNSSSTLITDNANWIEFTGGGGGNGSVIHLNAYTSDGHGYTASGTNTIPSYSQDALYIVNFTSANVGASVSLDIDSLGERVVKKTDGSSLTNIITGELTTNYQYYITYNGTDFELLNPGAGGGSGLSNKYYIGSTENVTVPSSTQYWIYGDLTLDGVLDNYGQVIVANGSLNVNSGTFNDYGTYSNIYFAEINGLGQTNYVPRWVTPYMLTASSSIYDNGNQVIISAPTTISDTTTISGPTFSVLNDFILPNGASDGYVLTSDSNGFATWQQGITKYSATFSFGAHATQSIAHNLNSSAIIFNFWDEDTGFPATVNVHKYDLNTIEVMSTVAVANGRVVIIS
jgi:hypothetical protein